MKKKQLGVCVPTYNHPENIRQYINKQITLFENYDIDLHIYDSSEEDTTEDVVNETRQRGYRNIYYHRVGSGIPSNIKVYQIFEEAADSIYQYVWMIHDHTVCTEAALIWLLKVLNYEKDFYVLNMQSGGEKIEKFKNLDDFLLCSAWRLNSFGSSVIKTDTFLEGTDWERISKKYNDEKTLNYSHIGFYFERASEIDGVEVCEVHFDRKDFTDFRRGEKINWSRDTIRICMECWGNVIMRLPEVYAKKQETLRTQDKWFMSKYSLISYKKKGMYDWKTFLKYQKWIKTIYPRDYLRDFLISCFPYKWSLAVYTKELNARRKAIQKKNGEIYIFGAGRHAIECGQFLDDCGISYQKYIVTNAEGNPYSIADHPVEPIKREMFHDPVLVIVAVLTSGVSGVMDTLDKYKTDKTDVVVFGE